MELLEQVRVAFIGMPCAGKSTLLSSIISHLHKKVIKTDYLMNEEQLLNKSNTFRATKIICPFKDYELMLIDCPGNLNYLEQIKQGLDLSSIIVCLIDANNVKESKEYCKNILSHIAIHTKHIIYIYTKTNKNGELEFDSTLPNIESPLEKLLSQIDECSDIRINVEEEALKIANSILHNFDKKLLLFSGGKDSIVGHDICLKINEGIDVIWPKTGFDFKETERFIKGKYITKAMRSIPSGMDYNNTSLDDIYNAKLQFNDELEEISDLLIVNYRVSDDIIASKDHYIKLGTECHRFSPIFYFSEENIWRYIAKYDLEIPTLYFNGYRSIEDEPIANTSMPIFNTINEIIDYVHSHPFEDVNSKLNQLKQNTNITYF